MGADASKPHLTSDSEVGSLASELNLTVDHVKFIMSYWPPHKEELKISKFKRFIEAISANMPDVDFLSTKGFADELFWLFDRDHNGMVSKREFLSGLSILASGDPTERAKMLFTACDLNGDGQITKVEFIQALRVSMTSCISLIKVQLKSYIHKHPGSKISFKMISKMIATAVHVNADQFAELAFKADTDHNGTLSMEEWMSSFEKNAAISRLMSYACGDLLIDLEELKGSPDPKHLANLLATEYPILDQPTIETLLHEYDTAAALDKLKRRSLTGSLGFGF
ncbi:[FeFe]-hydrogenase, mitochondrial [Pelomyxa schiedti]|nr:[FeFe]-hydrogenase, mitochondrial [Pelomyxa schiedti]